MIIHVLKDGTQPENIDGHVVKRQDAPEIYALVEKEKKENLSYRGGIE